jgi:uncharacterized protein (TIGR00369 family)
MSNEQPNNEPVATGSHYELLKHYLAGDPPEGIKAPISFPPTISKTLGFHLVEISVSASATMEMEVDPTIHANPMGTIHGGVLCDIADAAIGIAHWSTLNPGESFTSIDLKINFFRPLWKSRIRATARVVNRGNTISYYTCDITCKEDERLVATVTSTIMTLRGDHARGR